ncbi:hypothetical protein [Methanobrevibacter sp. DSM 116169]|uniref:hypothetical protein n=1 Tax=Methanobrevibacter sp. DSM 116169 TaxID=3242727 RepID=UPI0038FCAB9F
MTDFKEIKEMDIISATKIGTGIQVAFGILFAVVLLIFGGIIGGMGVVSGLLSIACTIVFGSLIYYIFAMFTQSYLYNILIKYLTPISVKIKDNEILEEVSVMSTAIIAGLVTLILAILLYLASIFIIPMLFTSIIQTLMFSEQMALAFTLYQFLSYYTNPLIIIMILLVLYISVFIGTAISIYLYNVLSKKINPIKFKLSQEGDLTSIDYINPINLAIISGVISLIVNVIFGIILALITGEFVQIAVNGVTGFVSGIVTAALVAIFYNVLSKYLGTLKIKLNN